MKSLLMLAFLSLLCSCREREVKLVQRNELQPFPDADIQRLILNSDSLIAFDSKLGWYDAEHGWIEGWTVAGIRDTVPLSNVRTVEVVEYQYDTLAEIGLIFLVLSIGMAFVFYNLFSDQHGGCMVFFAVIGLGTLCAVAIWV